MSDYDYDPRQAPSVYLRLKERGDKVTIRIASSPYREPKVWKAEVKAPLGSEEVLKLTGKQWGAVYRDPDFNVTEVFHWKVLDRDSGEAKIFTGTGGVYKTIKEYAQMEAWGDPQGYDFQIERTEEPGRNYYKVTPLPNKEPLTARQDLLIVALDMKEKQPCARKLTERQLDYMADVEQEYDAEEVTPIEPAKATPTETPTADDVVIEDIGDQPINLDDIPF